MATISASPASRSRRRFLRFSVRGLIALILLIASGLGWLVSEAHDQRDAVAAIKRAGGVVAYDWEWRDGDQIPSGKPRAPNWLVDRIGVDFFGHVTSVEFYSHDTLTDGPMVQFERLPQVEKLVFTDATVSNAGLSKLKDLRNLRALDLSGCEIDDTKFAAMKALTSLQSLRLSDSPLLTDVGLKNLERLSELKSLDLSMTSVTDSGLLHLIGLNKLSQLNLCGTEVSDAGLANLNGMTTLSQIDLHGTRVTDAGLAHLKALANLSELRLCFTGVTDAGLVHLKSLTKLLFLDLQFTQVTDAGIRELKEAAPNLRIRR